jgi:hypothetical protein
VGEKGEWIADALRGVALIGVAVRGKSFVESVLSDCGMRNLRSV